ncbi:hypothetical protein BAE44_0015296 [Dichanthelium oligosanthes]|uniref:Protein kinase domain-containing protein n=1 Tax=Dichanthelium oligosanthes TaxID=888268 RepID=A0A1E5VF55_9POAL|nr:hypothetical protein BAE44_0015296 [Dichanthelium oligosanthes]
MLAGTMGYMDPECFNTGRTSAASDVYSFGVVLLEIACGRKPILPHEKDEGKVHLVQCVWDLYGRGAILDAADARLLDGGELGGLEMTEHTLVVDSELDDALETERALVVDSELDAPLEMERVLVVGLWCVHPDYELRPSIRQAMNVLQLEAPLPELPLEMPVATYGPPVATADSTRC